MTPVMKPYPINCQKMMFKHIKHDIYGCEVSFAVELPLYLKPSFKVVISADALSVFFTHNGVETCKIMSKTAAKLSERQSK